MNLGGTDSTCPCVAHGPTKRLHILNRYSPLERLAQPEGCFIYTAQMTTDAISNADLLLAVLVSSGTDRFERSAELAELFNAAAESSPLFGAFRWNPDYQSSKKLNEALNTLDLSGMVVGDNMPTRHFRIPNQAKKFGPRILDKLSPEAQQQVAELADALSKL